MADLIRTFIAIPLTLEIHKNLHDFIHAHGLDDRASGFRPVRAENIHLTLKFLGDVPSTSISAISEQLNAVGKKAFLFPVTVSGVGAFPGWRKNPRVIWVGVQPVEPLLHLFREVDAATAVAGYQSEKRAFSPHLTLARINQQFPAPRQAEIITNLMNLKTEPHFGSMTVRELVLFKSVLQPTGPIYTILSRHSFSA